MTGLIISLGIVVAVAIWALCVAASRGDSLPRPKSRELSPRQVRRLARMRVIRGGRR